MLIRKQEILTTDYDVDFTEVLEALRTLPFELPAPKLKDFHTFDNRLRDFRDSICLSKEEALMLEDLGLFPKEDNFSDLHELTKKHSITMLNLLRDIIRDTVNRVAGSEIYKDRLDLEIAIDLYQIGLGYSDSVIGALQLIIETIYQDSYEWESYSENKKIIFLNSVANALLKGALNTCGYTNDYSI